MPSGSEWIIVLVIVLLVFGGSQLPKLAKNLGKAQKEFKDGLAEALHTMPGRELNSIIKNNRTIKDTTLIPEGWTVIGVTTKKETEVTTPYLVICH